MTIEEIIADERFHTCGRCKYENTPSDGYPCNECVRGFDNRRDFWELAESEEAQPKQTDGSCLDFDFDKVKEILKKDSFDDLIVDHTYEEKQEQTRIEKLEQIKGGADEEAYTRL